MEKKTFQQGMLCLTEAFPNKSEANFDFYFSRLQDLDDESFKWAVTDIIDNVPKLNEVDNLIAMIRGRSRQYRKEKNDTGTPKITEERWDEPPKEWTELKQKLGMKK